MDVAESKAAALLLKGLLAIGPGVATVLCFLGTEKRHS